MLISSLNSFGSEPCEDRMLEYQETLGNFVDM